MTFEQTPPWPAAPAVFLDLDGTLLEIAETPDAATASHALRRVLSRLPGATGNALAIVSGRTVEDVDRVLAPHRLAVAGIHGLQRRRADGRMNSTPWPGEWIDDVCQQLRRFARAHPGLIVEHKRASLALHYRRRPDLEQRIEALVDSLVLPAGVEPLRGRKVVELKPHHADKGKAIRAYMSEAPFAGRTPVFAGDDVTDEAGFRVVNAMGGVSVKVGAGPTAAAWTLPGVADVLVWLNDAAASAPAPAHADE